MLQINGWMSIPDTFANRLFARGGWDSVTLDAQHGLFDHATIVASLQALSDARPRRLVRVPRNEAGYIGKVLDASADGIIAPMINSADEARALADACWYPPKGRRSFGPVLAALRTGGLPYQKGPAQAIEVLAMIETREALDAVDDIAAVDGITGLFVGPSDLALALGLEPGQDREEALLLDAYRRIIGAAKRAGKTVGIYCASPGYARKMAELGFSMVTVISDAALLSRAAAADCAAVREPA
ncbi:aldolase/citrate lyase family protein [Caballeronia sp. LZ065]|uniref:HpcH/HpaI aldolase family protein n=1 Tax=Caballeronia sp. LZ065 TaxID=3038571 RepID=UPI002865CF37|nr:aldolase/citrate lyase family protein [Caballeronia sp. LZ065]MDR5781564.1 aldolase/citrate lyase family protein [Caballeronia sp. LZ065]